VAFGGSPFDLTAYMDTFMTQVMEVSIKQVYGWVVYVCLALLLLFLFYDTPMRRTMKLMPAWKTVANEVKQSYWRLRKKK